MNVENYLQGFIESLEVGDEDFYAAVGRDLANFANGFGKNSGAAEIVVVAIHAGNYSVLQSQGGDSFGDAAGLIEIDGLRAAFGYGAKSATASADVTEQHESGGAVVPTFSDVGALSGLADGVQSEAAGQLF
jgi:hypothetical protein